MISIKLKKIVSQKRLSIIRDLVQTIGVPVEIQDVDGQSLWCNAEWCNQTASLGQKYPIEVSDTVIGWVVGEEKVAPVAALLSHFANQDFEKKMLANEVLDKYREITLLHNVAQTITTSLDSKQVARLVLEEALRLITATRGSVLLLDPVTKNLDILAAIGEPSQANARFKLKDDIVGSIVATGKGEIINDVASDARCSVGNAQTNALICTPANSLICVSLKTKEQIIGAILLERCYTSTPADPFPSDTAPAAFTAHDLKLLSLLAFQTASTLENALLHEREIQKTQREALIFRLANQIHHSLDLDTILRTTVSEIRRFLHIDRCLFIWHRPILPCLHPNHADCCNRPDRHQGGWDVVHEAKAFELPSLLGCYAIADLGQSAAALLDMQVVCVENIHALADSTLDLTSHSIPNSTSSFISAFTSVLALPVKTRSGAIGVLYCGQAKKSRVWSKEEVELVQTVIHQLAIALDQAELYEQSRSAAIVAQAQTQELQRTLYELQQTQAQLIQSEKMSSLGQLVAGIAHEINNPVNFVGGNINHANGYIKDLIQLLNLYRQHYPHPTAEIETLIEEIDLEFLADDLLKLLSSMKMGVERIRQIIMSLRNFSRLDHTEMKPVDIHEGIDSTLLILHNRLKPSGGFPGIQVIKHYEKLPLVNCYAGQLNQVFMNILANAIDALEEHQEPGIITIYTQLVSRQIQCPTTQQHAIDLLNQPLAIDRSDLISTPAALNPVMPNSAMPNSTMPDRAASDIVVLIQDNGPGMHEDVCQKLFDPFFTTKPVGKGTGLGLSISNQIVEKHRGLLRCLSQPGQGTSFWIQIPVTISP